MFESRMLGIQENVVFAATGDYAWDEQNGSSVFFQPLIAVTAARSGIFPIPIRQIFGQYRFDNNGIGDSDLNDGMGSGYTAEVRVDQKFQHCSGESLGRIDY